MRVSIVHHLDHARPRHALASLVAGVCVCALAATTVMAASPGPAQAATYNPLNVISYETWRASSAMSVEDIQAFLNTLSGPLKSYSCTDTVTSTKPTRRSAASIIQRCAQRWNLNPKVILATLQKEQSLLTTSNSDNAKRLVKAMGCGVYGDADHDGKTDNRFPGFASQIYNGARVFSTYEITYGWYPGKIKRVTAYKNVEATRTVGGQVETYTKRVSYQRDIKPVNACTFALYTYTPYYPQKLFWDVYTRYFGDTQTPPRLRPLYRFRGLKNGTYLYTTSEAKRYRLVKDSTSIWDYDGVALRVDTSATANTVPLYQMYNTRTHGYLYTTLASTRDRLLKVRPKQWRFDLIACYVSRQTSGTAPVYKLRKKATDGALFTSSASLKASLSTGRSAAFTYLGVAFRLDSLETTVPVGPAR